MLKRKSSKARTLIASLVTATIISTGCIRDRQPSMRFINTPANAYTLSGICGLSKPANLTNNPQTQIKQPYTNITQEPARILPETPVYLIPQKGLPPDYQEPAKTKDFRKSYFFPEPKAGSFF